LGKLPLIRRSGRYDARETTINCKTLVLAQPGTAKEHTQAKRAYLDCIKLSSGCARCGGRDWPARVFDFHHRDPSTKDIPPHRLPHDAGWKRLLLEIAKCDVLCANCHRVVELEREMSD